MIDKGALLGAAPYYRYCAQWWVDMDVARCVLKSSSMAMGVINANSDLKLGTDCTFSLSVHAQ